MTAQLVKGQFFFSCDARLGKRSWVVPDCPPRFVCKRPRGNPGSRQTHETRKPPDLRGDRARVHVQKVVVCMCGYGSAGTCWSTCDYIACM